jgi:predicted secreted protein
MELTEDRVKELKKLITTMTWFNRNATHPDMRLTDSQKSYAIYLVTQWNYDVHTAMKLAIEKQTPYKRVEAYHSLMAGSDCWKKRAMTYGEFVIAKEYDMANEIFNMIDEVFVKYLVRGGEAIKYRASAVIDLRKEGELCDEQKNS